MNPKPANQEEKKTPDNTVTIRHLQMNEMYIMDQIAEQDGRNPGLNDGEFLFNASNMGFVAAIFNTEVIGTVSMVNYPDNLSFLGLHYVVPHLREHGVAQKLLSVALNLAKDSDIGLNCKEQDVSMYEEAGFETDHRIITYEGVSDGKLNLPENVKSPFSHSFEELYDYYKKVFPYERLRFTSFWLNQPKSLLLGKHKDGEFKGVGLFKPCKKGYRLAPLIADDIQSAQEILVGLSSHFPAETPYYVDIPEPNSDAVTIADEMGLKKVDEKLRMYKGNKHQVDLNKCYSYTSLEVG